MLQISDMDQVTDPNSIIAFWNSEARQLPAYLYSGMLRPTPISGDSTTLFFGQNHVPAPLNATTDDVKANFDNETDKLQKASYHVLGFKKGRQMSEKYMNEIRTAMYDQPNNAGLIQSLTRLTYKDQDQLLIGAQLNRELLFEQELNDGVIDLEDNGISDRQDFHMPANHRLGVNVAWNTTGAQAKNVKPIENLNDAKRYIADELNVNEIMAIMNDHTFLEMIHDSEIVQGVNPNTTNPQNMPVNPQAALRMVQAYTGMNIKIYDKGLAGSRFIPDGRVILVPENTIGRLLYAPTNEQLNLQNSSDARIANSGAGMTVTSYKSINPTGPRIIVSQKILPVIDDLQEILSIDTYTSVDQGNSMYTVNPLPTGNASSSNSSSNNSSSNKGSNQSSTSSKKN